MQGIRIMLYSKRPYNIFVQLPLQLKTKVIMHDIKQHVNQAV
jgi:hypothetical protein